MSKVYDLVIVGGGCVGVAAAYYAREKGWNVCIIESQGFFSSDRYWSSSFSARQNRLQYSEEYLTRYVIESNKEW
jgi:glycine/D-amino acid oxidase-like deaminating enzyme